MQRSSELYKQAQDVLVGGVNSPVRAFNAVDSDPIFFERGKGAYLYSYEGQKFIDYVLSFGPLILGHAHPAILQSIQHAAEKGCSFGAPTAAETVLAKEVQSFFPNCQKLRFVNSGTEATMSALRLARGVTKRDLIVKFQGCYHGHVDALLVSAGSGALTMGRPDSEGVPDDLAKLTAVLPYNDVSAVKSFFQEKGKEIAAVIVEPICGNMGVIPGTKEFLTTLREECDQYGALLIFDEVMTGFRAAEGTVQKDLGLDADITCLGKVIGGGLPCGAYGGSRDIMGHVAPEGPVYQAGTLSGNPLVMAAGIATLKELKQSAGYQKAKTSTDYLVGEIRKGIKRYQLDIQVHQAGTMFTIFFAKGPIVSLDSLNRYVDLQRFRYYFQKMLSAGIYIPPSQYEANFLSSQHSSQDLEKTIQTFFTIVH